MDRRTAIGLMGLGLIGVVSTCLEAGENAERQADETSNAEKKPIDARQDLIKNEIEAFASKYLTEGQKTQKTLRDSIQNNGLESVVNAFGSVGLAYLALAREKADSPEKYDEKQLEEKYQEISRNYMIRLGKVMNHTPIDYSTEEVRNNWASWIKLKTEYFERLLASDVNTEDYGELVKKTFSVEEYRDFLKRETEIITNIYSAFYNSRVGVEGLFAEGEVKSDRDYQIRFSEEESYRVYPEAKPIEGTPAGEKKE